MLLHHWKALTLTMAISAAIAIGGIFIHREFGSAVLIYFSIIVGILLGEVAGRIVRDRDSAGRGVFFDAPPEARDEIRDAISRDVDSLSPRPGSTTLPPAGGPHIDGFPQTLVYLGVQWFVSEIDHVPGQQTRVVIVPADEGAVERHRIMHVYATRSREQERP